MRIHGTLINPMWSILLFALCGCATHQISHGVPNLAQVEPGVWRGGQPDAEGWEYLKSLGIRQDVKLNTSHEGSDALAASNGIQINYLPITFLQTTVGKPNLNTLNAAIASIKPGTYVHCEYGQDRTGLIVGVYRVKVEHWTKEQAYQEMLRNGFHPILRGLYWSWEEDVP